MKFGVYELIDKEHYLCADHIPLVRLRDGEWRAVETWQDTEVDKELVKGGRFKNYKKYRRFHSITITLDTVRERISMVNELDWITAHDILWSVMTRRSRNHLEIVYSFDDELVALEFKLRFG